MKNLPTEHFNEEAITSDYNPFTVELFNPYKTSTSNPFQVNIKNPYLTTTTNSDESDNLSQNLEHKCPNCDKTFKGKWHRNRHLVSFHGVTIGINHKIYDCDYEDCTYKTIGTILKKTCQ